MSDLSQAELAARVRRLGNGSTMSRPATEKLYEQITGEKRAFAAGVSVTEVYALAIEAGWRPKPRRRPRRPDPEPRTEVEREFRRKLHAWPDA